MSLARDPLPQGQNRDRLTLGLVTSLPSLGGIHPESSLWPSQSQNYSLKPSPEHFTFFFLQKQPCFWHFSSFILSESSHLCHRERLWPFPAWMFLAPGKLFLLFEAFPALPTLLFFASLALIGSWTWFQPLPVVPCCPRDPGLHFINLCPPSPANKIPLWQQSHSSCSGIPCSAGCFLPFVFWSSSWWSDPGMGPVPPYVPCLEHPALPLGLPPPLPCICRFQLSVSCCSTTAQEDIPPTKIIPNHLSSVCLHRTNPSHLGPSHTPSSYSFLTMKLHYLPQSVENSWNSKNSQIEGLLQQFPVSPSSRSVWGKLHLVSLSPKCWMWDPLWKICIISTIYFYSWESSGLKEDKLWESTNVSPLVLQNIQRFCHLSPFFLFSKSLLPSLTTGRGCGYSREGGGRKGKSVG